MIKDTKPMKASAHAVVGARKSTLYDSIIWPLPVSNGSYLDVDGILSRSLPRVAGEKPSRTVSEKLSALAANGLKPFSETQT